jgi:hypothetical protein
MSKNIEQIYSTNPITSNNPADLMYFGQSPYGPSNDAAMTFTNFAAQFASPITPSALTEVNDTNVTLTLGGTPSTALLEAVSLTLGWSGTLSPTRGGTGINNGTSTISVGGNFQMSGGYTFEGILTGNTDVTYPTSGTLATTSQLPVAAALTASNDTNVTLTLGGTPSTALLEATSITAGWTGTLSPARGGTGVNNGSSTITIGANFLMSGAYTFEGVLTANTDVTFPTSGTLATTSQLPTGAALTEVNDTNVTLTLGGTPSTALLQATSITAGWTGVLSLARGGTNNGSISPSSGGIVYSTSSALALLAATATANQVLLSGASTTPAWSSATYPATTTINQILYSSSANVIGGISAVNSAVMISSSGGVPSFSTTLPSGLSIPGYQTTITPAALTEANDTNVTLTLSGTPSTALLQAVEITAGWSGTLSLARGGTAAGLTASAGSIAYSSASAIALTAAGTSGQLLASAGTGEPVWTTNTYPSTDSKGDLLYASAANTIGGLGIGSTGNILTIASGLPAWTTATYPSTTTINQILYSSAASVVGGITTADSSVLLTNSSGVPAWASTIAAANLIALGNSGVSAIKSTTFSLASATNSTATISSIGFTPSLCIVFANVNDAAATSWGMDNGTQSFCIFNNGGASSGEFGNYSAGSIVAVTGASAEQVSGSVVFSSSSSGEATWTFSKTGSPTGTLTIIALFFK